MGRQAGVPGLVSVPATGLPGSDCPDRRQLAVYETLGGRSISCFVNVAMAGCIRDLWFFFSTAGLQYVLDPSDAEA